MITDETTITQKKRRFGIIADEKTIQQKVRKFGTTTY